MPGTSPVLFRILEPEVFDFDVNLDTQVDTGVPDQGCKACEVQVRVGLAIAGDDKLAPPAQKLDGGQVLDMAAVRQVDPIVDLVQPTAYFAKKGPRPHTPLETLPEAPTRRIDFAGLLPVADNGLLLPAVTDSVPTNFAVYGADEPLFAHQGADACAQVTAPRDR